MLSPLFGKLFLTEINTSNVKYSHQFLSFYSGFPVKIHAVFHDASPKFIIIKSSEKSPIPMYV